LKDSSPFLFLNPVRNRAGFSVWEIRKDTEKKHQPLKKGLVLEIPQCSVSSSMLRSSATRGDTVLTAASLEISTVSIILPNVRQVRAFSIWERGELFNYPDTER